VRIAKNHPLPDGNKRLAWSCLVMFVVLNGHQLEVPPDAVSTMLAVAAGDSTRPDSPAGSQNGFTLPK